MIMLALFAFVIYVLVRISQNRTAERIEAVKQTRAIADYSASVANELRARNATLAGLLPEGSLLTYKYANGTTVWRAPGGKEVVVSADGSVITI